MKFPLNKHTYQIGLGEDGLLMILRRIQEEGIQLEVTPTISLSPIDVGHLLRRSQRRKYRILMPMDRIPKGIKGVPYRQ